MLLLFVRSMENINQESESLFVMRKSLHYSRYYKHDSKHKIIRESSFYITKLNEIGMNLVK